MAVPPPPSPPQAGLHVAGEALASLAPLAQLDDMDVPRAHVPPPHLLDSLKSVPPQNLLDSLKSLPPQRLLDSLKSLPPPAHVRTCLAHLNATLPQRTEQRRVLLPLLSRHVKLPGVAVRGLLETHAMELVEPNGDGYPSPSTPYGPPTALCTLTDLLYHPQCIPEQNPSFQIQISKTLKPMQSTSKS